jgi:hypothetical protein
MKKNKLTVVVRLMVILEAAAASARPSRVTLLK